MSVEKTCLDLEERNCPWVNTLRAHKCCSALYCVYTNVVLTIIMAIYRAPVSATARGAFYHTLQCMHTNVLLYIICTQVFYRTIQRIYINVVLLYSSLHYTSVVMDNSLRVYIML